MIRRRGFTLVEVLVYGIILMIASGTVISVMLSLGKTQSEATAYPTAQSQAQDALTSVAAYLRRAPLCDQTLGCSGVLDSAVSKATSNALTIYTSATGGTASFTTSNGALLRAESSGTATIVPDSLTMRYQYMLSSERSYTFTANAEAYTWLDSLSNAEMPSLVAVKITATIVRDGLTSTQSSIVRLRNSPKKTFGTG
jgi:type II secretory pathway pseudopilin PulG